MCTKGLFYLGISLCIINEFETVDFPHVYYQLHYCAISLCIINEFESVNFSVVSPDHNGEDTESYYTLFGLV